MRSISLANRGDDAGVDYEAAMVLNAEAREAEETLSFLKV
jgi:hypothetical protein